MIALPRRTALAAAAAAAALPRAALAQAPMVFHRGNATEPGTLDPHLADTSWENHIIGDLFLGLTTEDAEARPIPGCATSWSATDDGLVWTFKLREDIVWSDGVPVTAKDFVYSFRRLMDPATSARYASLMYIVKNAEAVNTGKLAKEELGVRAPDDVTFEITLNQPAPFLASLVKHYTCYAVPEHVIARHGTEWTRPGNMVSNGAYLLADWKIQDRLKAVKNPRFYDAANVAIDEVYYYPIDDERVAFTRFRAGEIDANITNRGFPSQQIPWLRENMPDQGRINPYLSISYLNANIRRRPFNDLRLRRALSLGIDRDIITAKVWKDGRLPAHRFVPPGIDNYVDGARFDYADWPAERRREEARRLLAECGYGPDNPLEFEYKHMTGFDPRREAVALAAMWKDVGIIAHLLANEPKIHYNMIQAGDFEVCQANWVADYDDPQNFLYMLESNAGAFNYSGYVNAEYDRLMAEAKVTLDLARRAEIMRAAEQIMLDELGCIPYMVGVTKVLVAAHVKGYVDNATNWHRTRFMRIERETA